MLTASATISLVGGCREINTPDRRLLAVQHAAQVPHVFDAGLAAFDLDDDLLGLGRARVVAEKDLAVNAVVGPFLLLDGPRADQAQRPPLELIFVLLGQDGGFVGRDRVRRR